MVVRILFFLIALIGSLRIYYINFALRNTEIGYYVPSSMDFYNIANTINGINTIMTTQLLIKSNETYCRSLFESGIRDLVKTKNLLNSLNCYSNFENYELVKNFKNKICGLVTSVQSIGTNLNNCAKSSNVTECAKKAIQVETNQVIKF